MVGKKQRGTDDTKHNKERTGMWKETLIIFLSAAKIPEHGIFDNIRSSMCRRCDSIHYSLGRHFEHLF